MGNNCRVYIAFPAQDGLGITWKATNVYFECKCELVRRKKIALIDYNAVRNSVDVFSAAQPEIYRLHNHSNGKLYIKILICFKNIYDYLKYIKNAYYFELKIDKDMCEKKVDLKLGKLPD